MIDKKAMESLLQSVDSRQLAQLKNALEKTDSDTLQKQLQGLDSRKLDRLMRQLGVRDQAQKATVENLLGQVKRNPGLIDELRKKL